MSRARGLALLVAVAVPVGVGCMFIVDGELGSIHCLDEGAEGPPACPEGQVCFDGLCGTNDRGPTVGTPCSIDADCAPEDFCLDPAPFGADGPPSCSRKCCSSSDCDRTPESGDPEPFVCWVPTAAGGNFCRRAALLGRGETGEAKAGDSCVSDVACRSGACVSLRCADVCCSDANCAAAGARCQLRDGAGAIGASWSCAATPAAMKGFLQPCASDTDCISGLCVEIADMLLCSEPCCDSTACGKYEMAPVSGLLACVDLPRHGTLVRACARVLPDGASLAAGAPCMEDADCRSGNCIEVSSTDTDAGARQKRFCSDVCCVDEDCGDKSTLACRPYELGATWALRCELK